MSARWESAGEVLLMLGTEHIRMRCRLMRCIKLRAFDFDMFV